MALSSCLSLFAFSLTFIMCIPVQSQNCDIMDAIFIIDTSGSMKIGNFTKAKEYAIAQIKTWNIGFNAIRIGLIIYGNNGVVKHYLIDTIDLETTIRAINSLPFMDQKTNLPGGLKAANENGFNSDNGDRPGVKNVAIVIGDSEPNNEGATKGLTMATDGNILVRNNVEVFFITLDYYFKTGESQRSDYQIVVSNPEKYFFEYSDFNSIHIDAVNKVNAVLFPNGLCAVTSPSTLPSSTTTTTTITTTTTTPSTTTPTTTTSTTTTSTSPTTTMTTRSTTRPTVTTTTMRRTTTRPSCVYSNSCGGHYSCDSNQNKVCLSGWTGSQCTQEVVRHSSCVGGEKCRYLASCSNGQCCCPPNYTGSLCETTINACDPDPCVGKGTCYVPDVTKPLFYSCSCPDGGSSCSAKPVGGCLRGGYQPCYNGGVCVDEKCVCKAGYTGTMCETLINPCDSNPCLNDAVCSVPNVDPQHIPLQYVCTCTQGWFGPRCGTPCHCLDQAVCASAGDSCPGGCQSGWHGPGCQIGNVDLMTGSSAAMVGSSNGNFADLAVDGDMNTEGSRCARASSGSGDTAWLEKQLDTPPHLVVFNVSILFPASENIANIWNTWIQVGKKETGGTMSYSTCAYIAENDADYDAGTHTVRKKCDAARLGSVVRVQRDAVSSTPTTLNVCELMADGYYYSVCPQDRWGPGCVLTCSCATCDSLTGHCLADPTQLPTYTYAPFWPYDGDRIKIEGNLFGLSTSPGATYEVNIGTGKCRDVLVSNDHITCLPPKEKPLPRPGMDKLDVTVLSGGTEHYVGDMRYLGIMDTSLGLWSIFIAFGILAIIFLLCMICIICCRNRKDEEEKEDRYHSMVSYSKQPGIIPTAMVTASPMSSMGSLYPYTTSYMSDRNSYVTHAVYDTRVSMKQGVLQY